MIALTGAAIRAALTVTLVVVAAVVALGVLVGVAFTSTVTDDEPLFDQDDADEWPDMDR